jgi:hypothetical protein
MSGFDASWLALREPFDQAARSEVLATRFVAALAPLACPVLIDLGGGTAANFRVLAPLIGRDQRWRLIDHDPKLIEQAIATVADWAADRGWAIERPQPDQLVVLTPTSGRWALGAESFDLSGPLQGLAFDRCDGVVTTAFLDLVSQVWVERFAIALAASRRPLLATLTVDGRRIWTPEHPVDRLIDEAFRRHQGGDKGFGPSLGVDAAQATARALEAHGFRIELRESDWRIGIGGAPQIEAARHRAMLETMIDETAAVALQAAPDQAPDIARWRADRSDQLERGQASFRVGHLDLLALA